MEGIGMLSFDSRTLNELGEDGWELVNVKSQRPNDSGYHHYIYFLKRPLN
jgi:hypothetical protein